MRPVLAAMIAYVCLGCGSVHDEPTDIQQPIDTPDDSTVSSGAGCNTEVVETILPGYAGADVVTLCKSCDRGCDDLGMPCATYGEPCDFFGERGVCGACCDGERGRLRCHPVE